MKESVEYIRKDLYRYYEKEKLTIIEKIKMSPSIKYMILFRRIQFCKNSIIKKFLILRLYLKQRKTYIQIPYNTKIGKGFYIGHLGRVIINSDTTIGENVNIATGVTIGQINKGKKKGSPIIGNNVWIGTNSVIVGNIKIGNNVLIAPNAYVNFDVPDNSIVIGNPGIIHYNEKATEGYIEKKI